MNLKFSGNRILLEDVLWAGTQSQPGTITYIRSGSSLSFLVEEFVSLAVAEIAVPEGSRASEFIYLLPDSLKRRVVVVDNLKAYTKLQAIFAPIAEEFDIEFSPDKFIFKEGLPKELSIKLPKAIMKLYLNIYRFLLGLENQLQIDIDLESSKRAIATLLRSSRNPDSRANLATFSGIFETYAPQTVDSLVLRSGAPEQLISIFQEFLEDETYKHMSVQAHYLGFPAHLRRSVVILGRLAKKLITKAPFKAIVNLSSKGISAATSLPIPDSEMYASLINTGYFPPIVSYKEAAQKAKERFAEQHPQYKIL